MFGEFRCEEALRETAETIAAATPQWVATPLRSRRLIFASSAGCLAPAFEKSD
jgi:hypothetical protein